MFVIVTSSLQYTGTPVLVLRRAEELET